ncbi:MAG TPA: hypothetical protein VGZ47_00935 [Gemmataceae bacterium]|jgi:hypothetical protein|nr:hypothetical protein [Gemmataceae bacterium]
MTVHDAWNDRALDLANWAWNVIVCRVDVWGGYYSNADGNIGPVTNPPKTSRGKAWLSKRVLQRHFAATSCRDIVGLHFGTPAPDSVTVCIAADLDVHSDDDDPALVSRFAFHVFHRLARIGYHPLLTGSNGKGGLHLREIFCNAIELPLAFRLARWMIRDWQEFGFSTAPEVYPKQAQLSPPGQPGEFGNWLRLPGRHHKREYWSEVWCQQHARWLAGADAVQAILNSQGDDPATLIQIVGDWQPHTPRPSAMQPIPVPDCQGGTRYGLAALKAEADAVASAPLSTRNSTLNKAAFQCGQLVGAGLLDHAGVELVLASAACACGLEEKEIRGTIRSGIRAGMAKPRKVGSS